MRMYNGFTVPDVTTVAGRGCRLLLWLLCVLVSLPVWGAEVLVVGDTGRPYFRAFSSSLATNLGSSGFEIKVLDTTKYEHSALANGTYRCIVTVGNDAARELSSNPSAVPILHALVTESFSHELYTTANGQAVHSFLLIDQPVSRLIWLARISMPSRHNLDVIYGPFSKRYRSEVRRQADNAELVLVEKEISEPDQ